MTTLFSEGTERILGKVADHARKALGRNTGPGRVADAVEFISQFYGTVAPDDLADKSVAALFGAAQSIWTLAAKRVPGQVAMRAFNPDPGQDGWKCPHTVVEIVNDDMPFLVDSVTAALTGMGLEVHVVIHPVLAVERDAAGAITRLLPGGPGEAPAGSLAESAMHVEVTRQTDPARLRAVTERLARVLADVRAAVEDWPRARARVRETVEAWTGCAPDADEAKAFLSWLVAGHFTLLGARDYRQAPATGEIRLVADEASGLGLLRDPASPGLDELLKDSAGRVADLVFGDGDHSLLITKTNRVSTVHRPVAMDAIAVKQCDAAGKVTGLRLFVGLFTADVYTNSPGTVPILRGKIEQVVDAAGLKRQSHDGKKLVGILENLPRDELFQSDEAYLGRVALGVLYLQERRRTALFVRTDEFERFVSCLVFMPRDRLDTPLRIKVFDILKQAFDGEILAFYIQVGDESLARLQVMVRTRPGKIPAFDVREIEARIARTVRAWEDRLSDALIRARGEEEATPLLARYARAFPAGYAERFGADEAVADIARAEEALAAGRLGIHLYAPEGAAQGEVRLKIYSAGRPLALSDVLPMLEAMGLKVIEELPFALTPEGSEPLWIHDLGMSAGKTPVDVAAVRDRFEEAFARVLDGDMDSDGFNRLVLSAGMTWREVSVFRGYARFLRQVLFPFSQTYMSQALVDNPLITRDLADLFLTRFDPARGAPAREADDARLKAQVLSRLDGVESADADRVLRRFLNLVEATLRTNFFQRDANGKPLPLLAFKLASGRIDDMPKPCPLVEVFMTSPRLEAAHLRAGKVARGGIRWSDRPEDFRTEILGLMKAQQVKNAVIVPVGAKGGFIVRRPPAEGGREAFQREGIACYREFMRTLLAISDNLKDGKVVPPKDVVRHDADDPYLVVAADKGTATFSDFANSESLEAGFWLGDAFASGGSQGYDHKAIAITARGAWECVKRHFREIGTDIQKTPFTVVGVGDMSGDVFGNGMLRSDKILLIAAFNHMHIFLDPDPDPAVAFAERQRLFDLPRSSWADYDPAKLSAGGAVFSRQAKTVKVSQAVMERLDLSADTLTPNELIHAILTAPVDLLYFGGIGTYVRASGETDAQVGDRANDAVRITGRMIRAKVLGEGANLGVTQRGRIEYAQAGGRINTDAVDNSAGVDCSDHEVNVKILLNAVVAAGGLTMEGRNALLAETTDEVAVHVLRDNYLQGQALSLMEAHGPDRLDEQARLLRHLEHLGRLDRAIEFLPGDEEIADRLTKHGILTRSESAILMPYCKMWLFDEILDSDLPDDPAMEPELMGYFPAALRERFAEPIRHHRLKREIVATIIANALVNRVGGTFLTEMIEETGRTPSDIARAFMVVRNAFDLEALWADIESLDNRVPAQVQMAMLLQVNRMVRAVVVWVLRHTQPPVDMAGLTARFAAGARALRPGLEAQEIADSELVRAWREAGVPDPLVRRVLAQEGLVAVPDVVNLAETRWVEIPLAAEAYDLVGRRFGFGWLRAQTQRLGGRTHWQKLAAAALVEDFYEQQRDVARDVLTGVDKTGPTGAVAAAVSAWAADNAYAVEPAARLLAEYQSAPQQPDLAMLTVAARQFRTMARG